MFEELLQREFRDVPLVVFDLETTGLSPRLGDEIVEIGAIKARGDKILSTFHGMVNPGRSIPSGASSVNGITDDMLEGAPPIEEVLPLFIGFMDGLPLVAHNADFDTAFIARKALEMHLPERDNIVIDTLKLARRLRPGLSSHSLAAMSRETNADIQPGHRSSSDTLATWLVLRSLLAPLEAAGPLTLASVLDLQAGPTPWPRFEENEVFFSPESPVEMKLHNAIENSQTLEIEYTSSSRQVTVRKIRPIRMSRRYGRAYLIADCRLRNDQRIFRIDRINRING